MRKQLITAIFASAFTFSAHCAMADVTSNLEADIEVDQRGNNTATASNIAGSDNEVQAVAGAGNITIDASDGTDINSEIDVNIDVNQRGHNTATASNIAGSDNDVSATAGAARRPR